MRSKPTPKAPRAPRAPKPPVSNLCKTCKESPPVMDVEQIEDDWGSFCGPCGASMQGLVLEIFGRVAQVRATQTRPATGKSQCGVPENPFEFGLNPLARAVREAMTTPAPAKADTGPSRVSMDDLLGLK